MQPHSYFLKKKSETAAKVVELIKHLKTTLNYQVKFIRCDNAGENLKLEEACKKEGLGVTFEYTAPKTPQQNGRVERGFATLYGQVRSMLNAARLNKEFRRGLWAKCACTACDLDNLDCDNKAGKPCYTEFYGKDYKAFPFLRKFGEIGIVTQGDAIKSKLVNRGVACLYLGHADNHSAEVSRFMKLSTKRVIRSCDVKWLIKTFKEYKNPKGYIKMMKKMIWNLITVQVQKMKMKAMNLLKLALQSVRCVQRDWEYDLLLRMKLSLTNKMEMLKSCGK